MEMACEASLVAVPARPLDVAGRQPWETRIFSMMARLLRIETAFVGSDDFKSSDFCFFSSLKAYRGFMRLFLRR